MLTAVTRRAPDRGLSATKLYLIKPLTSFLTFACPYPSIHAAKLGGYEMQYIAIGGILLLAGS